MVFAELFVGDIRLFARKVGRFQNFFAQPLVAARSRQHTAHQVIAAVSVRESVQGVIGVDTEFVGRDEDRAGRTERDVAAAVSHRARADRRRGVVEGMEDGPTGKMIRANVPLAEMFGYATDLRSLSQGRASYVMEFGHYAETPAPIAKAIIEERTAK